MFHYFTILYSLCHLVVKKLMSNPNFFKVRDVIFSTAKVEKIGAIGQDTFFFIYDEPEILFTKQKEITKRKQEPHP